ncbi:phosphate signaling complex protein PhoU [Coriobacteriia bacterium Es71-Z0120]|uniref:phosphate signaling complex protein PhoU n=1 Tax=Parvivirga hydrogeniphila TaxID=2939460 RepID=UPI0022608864|nr:phosphate signaling complex protein PhoU [Parvivirga hydrogeniphila]MCL4079094.1 phosphate signaling complex protein PhoU [Parvivirga hydrogeniphila]
MMREGFRKELKDLKANVLAIGHDIVDVTRDAVRALVEGDVELAQRVIDGDSDIDARCLGIEERSLEIIATQFPVARDLRLLHSLAYIAMHFERMADLAVNIAKAARRTAGRQGPQTLYDLIQAQGNLVQRVLQAMLEALEKNDLEMSRKLQDLDEPIDHLFKQFFRELARLQDEEDIEWGSSMVLASRYLERIADHAVDIGERITYMVTGHFASCEDDEA